MIDALVETVVGSVIDGLVWVVGRVMRLRRR